MASSRVRRLATLAVPLLSLAGSGCFTGAQHEIPPNRPIIHGFTATPESIVPGASTTLAWTVSGATTLSISPGVGPVTGTSVSVSPTGATTYTLTATNAGGSSTASVSVTVVTAPSGLTYSTNPAVYPVGTAISPNSPSSTGGAVTSYAVAPPLPTGLALDTTTGVISGTPTAATAQAVYTITATNGIGSTTAFLTLTVTGSLAPPAGLTYSANPATYPVGSAITPNTPSSSGGAVASYAVAPPLPAGLALDTTTGIITGTPTAATAQAVYTVTATNAAGSTTVALTVTVGGSVAPPGGLTYSTNPATYPVGSTITPNTPSSTGGAIASYAVSPALPAGLSLSATTGVVTGAPTAPTAQADYTVTGTNAAGSTTAALTITVTFVPGPPAGLSYSANPATYTVNTPIPANTPSSTGGTIASYTVNPALPAGLSLDAATGVVSGTPTAETVQAVYTITGTNPDGNASVGLSITVSASPTPSGFAPTGSMSSPREFHTATLLRDGRVLLAGGFDGSAPVRNAEIYDPVAGTFSATGSMATARQSHSASLLPDGRVLVSGGLVNNNLVATATAEVYDPAAGTFSPVANDMPDARFDFTSTTLPGGTVLVAGGGQRVPSRVYLATAALYDPATNRFTATGPLRTGRAGLVAVLIQGGKVLVAGGTDAIGSYLASAEIYDAAAGTFSTTGPMPGRRVADTATALQVSGSPPAATGLVLVAGGFDGSYVDAASRYDPSAGTFAPTGAMLARRGYQTASLLPDGTVLLAGGTNGAIVLATAEIYDPLAGTFSAFAQDMSEPRWHQTATTLQDGRVLVAGGNSGAGTLRTAEVFTP